MIDQQDQAKARAAGAALKLVHSGMNLGLGTGSTAKHFIDQLGARIREEGLIIKAMPTSEASRQQAESLNIPLFDEETFPELDMTVDGADEFDRQLNLIKGGGKAHTREKIVARSSQQLIIIADESKEVVRLGKFPLPLEIFAFGCESIKRRIQDVFSDLGLKGELLMRTKGDGKADLSDNGHLIYDAHLGRIDNPAALAQALDSVTGLVEHGLFIGLASQIIVASPDGVHRLKV